MSPLSEEAREDSEAGVADGVTSVLPGDLRPAGGPPSWGRLRGANRGATSVLAGDLRPHWWIPFRVASESASANCDYVSQITYCRAAVRARTEVTGKDGGHGQGRRSPRRTEVARKDGRRPKDRRSPPRTEVAPPRGGKRRPRQPPSHRPVGIQRWNHSRFRRIDSRCCTGSYNTWPPPGYMSYSTVFPNPFSAR